MDTRPEDNKPIERIVVRGTQPDSAMQRHHEAMQRHLRNMVMEGISHNAMSESIQAVSSETLKDMHHEAREWERIPGRSLKWSKLTSAERKHIRKILKKTKGNLNKLKSALRSNNTATKDKIAQHYGLSGADDADYGYLADGLEALVTDIVGKIDGVLSKADLNGVFRSTGNNHGEYIASTGGVYYEQKFFESSEASQIGTTAHEFGHAFEMDHHRTMTKERFMNERFTDMKQRVLYLMPGDAIRRQRLDVNIRNSYFLESAIDGGLYE